MLKKIGPFFSSILISDATVFEVYIKKNNPKFYANLHSIIFTSNIVLLTYLYFNLDSLGFTMISS